MGRGSFAFIVQGIAEPRLGKCNDSRPFCIHIKLGEVFAEWSELQKCNTMEAAMAGKEYKKSTDEKKPENLGSVQDFLGYVERYWEDTQKDNFPRYMSWEHCYEHFQESYSKVIIGGSIDEREIDSLALWLAWYLASWGMYRGSSDLLRHNYEVHCGAIRLLLDKRWKPLNNIECQCWNDDLWELLEELRGKMVAGYGKNVSLTDTLFTKILLGTLGCVPAFDNLFENSISLNSRDNGLLKKHVRKFNVYSISELCRFYGEVLRNSNVHCLNKMHTKEKKLPYPNMKILDMGFWNFWKENGKKNDNKGKEA